MKAFTFILIACLAVISCKDDDKGPMVCNMENPLEMPWIQAKIMAMEQSSFEDSMYIQQYEINGSYYFYFGNCCETCDAATWYYDCSGNQVTLAPAELASQPVSPAPIIWKGDNFKCQLM